MARINVKYHIRKTLKGNSKAQLKQVIRSKTWKGFVRDEAKKELKKRRR